jgi:hypothetical protein
MNGRRLQIGYMCSNIPPDRLSRLQKSLCTRLGTDPADLLRLPGTLTFSSDPSTNAQGSGEPAPTANRVLYRNGAVEPWQLDALLERLGLDTALDDPDGWIHLHNTSGVYIGAIYNDDWWFKARDANGERLGIFSDPLGAVIAVFDRAKYNGGAPAIAAPEGRASDPEFKALIEQLELRLEEPPPPEPDRGQLETFVPALFKHATAGHYVALRAFYEGHPDRKPFNVTSHQFNGDFDALIGHAYQIAERAAFDGEKVVFCPPIATFNHHWQARGDDLYEGLALRPSRSIIATITMVAA